MFLRRFGARWLAPGLVMLVVACEKDSTGDAPPPQVVLYVDTDAPLVATSGQAIWNDAAVDTLHIEVFNALNETIEEPVDIPAPDPSNWPISFGIKASGTMARIRLRAFRARNADVVATDGGGQKFVPETAYTIDRTVDIPLPTDKGLYGFRVVLRADCRGKRSDFEKNQTCIDATTQSGSFAAGLEVVDPHIAPSHVSSAWLSRSGGCAGVTNGDQVCIPRGFFVLGNSRVVGFSAQNRVDPIPPHPVWVGPFRIDRKEWTLADYIARVGHPPTAVAVDTGCVENVQGRPELPVSCVTWEEAAAACKANNGRLPTEAEWEYVATGMGRGYLFPWGDVPPDCTTAELDRSGEMWALCGDRVLPWESDYPGYHNDVTDEPAVNDLGGSVSEWVLDSFARYDEQCWAKDGVLDRPVCCLGAGAGAHVARGGNWVDARSVAYSALRQAVPVSSPATISAAIGFRCVYDLDGQTATTCP